MMDKEKCKTCGGAMIRGETINSGNAMYQVFYCKQCESKITKCMGVNNNKNKDL